MIDPETISALQIRHKLEQDQLEASIAQSIALARENCEITKNRTARLSAQLQASVAALRQYTQEFQEKLDLAVKTREALLSRQKAEIENLGGMPDEA